MIIYYDRQGNPMTDHEKWAEMMEGNRIVGRTERGGVLVSTVFLGLDHSFGGTNTNPLLFETMIFGGKHNDYQERYCCEAEALLGHREAVRMVWPKKWWQRKRGRHET